MSFAVAGEGEGETETIFWQTENTERREREWCFFFFPLFLRERGRSPSSLSLVPFSPLSSPCTFATNFDLAGLPPPSDVNTVSRGPTRFFFLLSLFSTPSPLLLASTFSRISFFLAKLITMDRSLPLDAKNGSKARGLSKFQEVRVEGGGERKARRKGKALLERSFFFSSLSLSLFLFFLPHAARRCSSALAISIRPRESLGYELLDLLP